MSNELISGELRSLAALIGQAESDLDFIRESEFPNRVQGLQCLRKWVASFQNPQFLFSDLPSQKAGLLRIMRLASASQPLGQILLQNPDLGMALLAPIDREQLGSVDRLMVAGRKILSGASNEFHGWDRLRFFKQLYTLLITSEDLQGEVPQPEIWHQITCLAEAVLGLASEWVSQPVFGDLPVPFGVIGFGKLGAGELNYSSDIDLVFVLQPSESEVAVDEQEVIKVCSKLTKVLEGKMGRGFLYRVDLRLRPYGRMGPLVVPFSVLESYYRNYSEPWERQALLRARIVFGSKELQVRFERLRVEMCFSRKPSESFLQAMVESLVRTRELKQGEDIKRSPGGIRDLEFYVQFLQLIYGVNNESVRRRPFFECVDALVEVGALSGADAILLKSAYTFLRKLEHRCQLFMDQQTHELPNSTEGQQLVAQLMGFETVAELRREWDLHRSVSSSFAARLGVLEKPGDSPSIEHLVVPPSIAGWLSGLDKSGRLQTEVEKSTSGLAALNSVMVRAPRLLPQLRRHFGLTESIISGEVEEPGVLEGLVREVIEERPIARDRLRLALTALALLSSYGSSVLDSKVISELRTRLWDTYISQFLTAKNFSGSLFGLGSFGRSQLTVGSDLDVIALVAERELQEKAEQIAQDLLAEMRKLALEDVLMTLDFRLRPDGNKGLLVRSFAGFKAYALEGMMPWEVFALRHRRLVFGPNSAEAVLAEIEDGFGAAGIAEILAMKARIEAERAYQLDPALDVKLGPGGLSDAEWLVGIYELHNPELRKRTHRLDFSQRLTNLSGDGFQLEDCRFLAAHVERLLMLKSLTELGLSAAPTLSKEGDDGSAVAEAIVAAFGSESYAKFISGHRQDMFRARQIYEAGLNRLQV